MVGDDADEWGAGTVGDDADVREAERAGEDVDTCFSFVGVLTCVEVSSNSSSGLPIDTHLLYLSK